MRRSLQHSYGVGRLSAVAGRSLATSVIAIATPLRGPGPAVGLPAACWTRTSSSPAPLDLRRARRLAGLSMPDVGGRTVLVRNRRVLASGAWPLRLRYRLGRSYLRRYSPTLDIQPRAPVRSSLAV